MPEKWMGISTWAEVLPLSPEYQYYHTNEISDNQKSDVLMIDIYPSTHPGYFYVSRISSAINLDVEYLIRPIYLDGVESILTRWGYNVHQMNWMWRKVAPSRKSPWHPPQIVKSSNFVYFIESPDLGLVKIGVSTDPCDRLKSLQTAHPRKLYLRAVIPGDSEVERSIHKKFSHLQEMNEWFRMTDEILSFVENISKEQK